MKKYLFLLSSIVSLNIGLTEASNLVHEDVKYNRMMPHLDAASLSNYASTNKENAVLVKKYKEESGLRKQAIIYIPSAEEVIQSVSQLNEPNRPFKTGKVTIGDMEYEIRGYSRPSDSDPIWQPNFLNLVKLAWIEIYPYRCSFFPDSIRYAYSNPGGDRARAVHLQRDLRPSESMVVVSTAKPLNPDDVPFVKYDQFTDKFVHTEMQPFLPENMRYMICEQKKSS